MPRFLRKLGQRARHFHRVVERLDLAGAGDEREGQAVADRQIADPHLGHTSLDCATAAAMKPSNSGCGAKGLDFSSGWYCTPMNQG